MNDCLQMMCKLFSFVPSVMSITRHKHQLGYLVSQLYVVGETQVITLNYWWFISFSEFFMGTISATWSFSDRVMRKKNIFLEGVTVSKDVSHFVLQTVMNEVLLWWSVATIPKLLYGSDWCVMLFIMFSSCSWKWGNRLLKHREICRCDCEYLKNFRKSFMWRTSVGDVFLTLIQHLLASYSWWCIW